MIERARESDQASLRRYCQTGYRPSVLPRLMSGAGYRPAGTRAGADLLIAAAAVRRLTVATLTPRDFEPTGVPLAVPGQEGCRRQSVIPAPRVSARLEVPGRHPAMDLACIRRIRISAHRGSPHDADVRVDVVPGARV